MDLTGEVPIVVTYSWKDMPTVFLCDNDDEAVETLRKLWEEEKRIEIEENEREDYMEADISSDGYYAYIKIFFTDCTDTTEWYIGDLMGKPSFNKARG